MIRVLAVLAFLVLAAPAAATTETASLGSIRAELSYTEHDDYPQATGLQLRVFDGDTQIAARDIPDDKSYVPIGLNSKTPSVSVRDLDGDGVGEAIFDLYTGGAHCCEISYIYKGSTEIFHNWQDPGYDIKDLDGDGTPELVSADARFEYAFGSFASSYPPLRIFRLEGTALVDVTRSAGYAPAVRKDARAARKSSRYAIRHVKKDAIYTEAVKSTLAAYTADECTLGHCLAGYRVVDHQIDNGLLKPSFTIKLQKLLKKLGYDRS